MREAAESREVRLITHADPHLPFCSPLPAVRQGAAEELKAAGRFVSLAGAEWLTVHLDRGRPDTSVGKRIDWYGEAILGMTEPHVPVLIENAPFQLGVNQPDVILGIAEAVSAEGVQVGATFDIAHALIEGHGDLGSYQKEPRYWELVRHVHVSEPDLSGPNADRHLPLGVHQKMSCWREWIDWIMARKMGEELAMTLEVHSQEPEYLRANLELLRRWLNR
ncbi:MAG: TIM barrel protein [Candidatus Berkelbacteria bacterium]|nr:TIM barrel protein [Candidatus Berkelbacteria bacterium]